MLINFDTSNSGPKETYALIALLTALYPNSGQPTADNLTPPIPTTEEQAIFGVPVPAAGPTLQTAIDSTSDAPTTTTTEQTTKRTRRTKAEMEAAANPTQGSAAAPVAVSGTTQAAPAQPSTAAAAAPKPIDADTLRGLLNGYIASHSMEEAIAILQSFGCNRVTEALALEPSKLNELAKKLNG